MLGHPGSGHLCCLGLPLLPARGCPSHSLWGDAWGLRWLCPTPHPLPDLTAAPRQQLPDTSVLAQHPSRHEAPAAAWQHALAAAPESTHGCCGVVSAASTWGRRDRRCQERAGGPATAVALRDPSQDELPSTTRVNRRCQLPGTFPNAAPGPAAASSPGCLAGEGRDTTGQC